MYTVEKFVEILSDQMFFMSNKRFISLFPVITDISLSFEIIHSLNVFFIVPKSILEQARICVFHELDSCKSNIFYNYFGSDRPCRYSNPLGKKILRLDCLEIGCIKFCSRLFFKCVTTKISRFIDNRR